MNFRSHFAAPLAVALTLISGVLLINTVTQVTAADVLTNGAFTADVVPWVEEPSPDNANVSHDAVEGNALAGSLQLQNTSLTDGTEGVAISECISVSAGTYDLTGSLLGDALNGALNQGSLRLQLYTDGACATPGASADSNVVAGTVVTWTALSATGINVTGATPSARVELILTADDTNGGIGIAHFDDVVLDYTAPTATPTSTPTDTPIPPTATDTATPTDTPLPPTATNTPLPTETPTDTPIPPTATDTPIPPTATNTPDPLATATDTPVPPTATNTAVPPTATNTAVSTATNTPGATNTPVATDTPGGATNTPAATSTPEDDLASPTSTTEAGPPPASVAGVTVAASDPNAPTGSTVSIAAAVTDVTGAGEPGVTCSFAITSQPGGDASLTATTAVTDANGVAQVELNVGSAAGPIVVESNCGGIVGNTTVVAGVSVGPAASSGEVAEGLPDTGTGTAQGSSPALYLFLFGVMSLIGCGALAAAEYRRLGQ